MMAKATYEERMAAWEAQEQQRANQTETEFEFAERAKASGNILFGEIDYTAKVWVEEDVRTEDEMDVDLDAMTQAERDTWIADFFG